MSRGVSRAGGGGGAEPPCLNRKKIGIDSNLILEINASLYHFSVRKDSQTLETVRNHCLHSMAHLT